ncbi:MAG TPA: ABC transporter substrate-binding protein [Burkholderiales bacterium]|nr:ABC transporter substrate-binding protein [Burkholderiales bacterium]
MRVSILGAIATGALASLLAFGAAAESIRIGLVSEITGPNAEAGRYTINGARLAVEQINKKGGILGKQVELVIEDNQSTNPGTVLAFSKLGGNSDIPAMIGPIRSTQVQAASPAIQKAGIPVMIGGTDPSLTHVNNPWVFRCRPNDSFSSRVIADFGVKKLKLKKWAIVHSTDAFGSGGQKALTDALKALGVEPVLVQGYTNNSQDFTPVVLAIKKSGADVIGTYMTNSQDLGIFAKQLRQLGVTATWVGSPSIVTDTAMKLAGEALHGTYGIADFNPDANAAAKAYAAAYRAKYDNAEPDVYSSWAFDAMNVIAYAINAAKSTKPDDIRKAILGLKNWKGVEGNYNFDANGDGLRGYNIVKNEGGKIKYVEHISFDK